MQLWYSNHMHSLQLGINGDSDFDTVKAKDIIAYKAELEELKTKEVAYKQTIEKGDAILEKVCNTQQNVLRI